MRKKIITVLIILSLTSCISRSKSTVEGNWYYFEEDSSYNELYFSNELFVYNLNAAFLSQIYQYRVINDSIFISVDSFKNMQDFLFKVESIKEDRIVLVTNDEKKIYLEPIIDFIPIWDGLMFEKDKVFDLEKGWFERNNEKIYGVPLNGTNSEDSLITLPQVIDRVQ